VKALVLSAGGLFGAYQAGAWQALEERGFRPDILVGASVGAINAAAIARGCTGPELQQLWRDPQSSVFRWNWPPQRLSLADPKPFEARLQKIFEQFPHRSVQTKLLVAVTELPCTKVRAVQGEQVTPRALLASCAIPFVYPPVKLHGKWCVDGGVFCRMPVAWAVQAGAAEIVAVDLLAAPPSMAARRLLSLLGRARGLFLREPNLAACPDRILLRRIEPSEPLGKLRDVMRWDRRNIDRWIEQGYRAAGAVLDRPFANQTRMQQPSTPKTESAAPMKTEYGL
jgi:NTE family protein